jgi:hypothetical protein
MNVKLKKERGKTLLALWAFIACYRVNFTFNHKYFYSDYNIKYVGPCLIVVIINIPYNKILRIILYTYSLKMELLLRVTALSSSTLQSGEDTSKKNL